MPAVHTLLQVVAGEVVSVLEENVGPSKNYHRARKLEVEGRDKSVPLDEGWFPKTFLERVAETKST